MTELNAYVFIPRYDIDGFTSLWTFNQDHKNMKDPLGLENGQIPQLYLSKVLELIRNNEQLKYRKYFNINGAQILGKNENTRATDEIGCLCEPIIEN